MLFSYKIKSKNGEISEGVQEAESRLALSHDLRLKGDIPISITEKGSTLSDKLSFFDNFLSRVKVADQILLTKNLGGMLKAGLSLSRAISVLKKQTKNKKLNTVLTSIASDIDQGSTFSFGLAKFPEVFSKLFVSMARAGEESGNLSGSLSEIGMTLEKSHSLTKKIHGALIYPGVIMSAMVVIGVLMFAFVVPTLAKTFAEIGVELPLSTRIIVFFGNFFSEHLIITFLLILISSFALYSLVRANFMTKYIDFIVLKLPVVGTLSKELNTARTARTMSSLLMSGVSFTRAIEITQDVVQNIYYKKVLEEAKVRVEKGAPFSEVFTLNLNLYPVMMSEMVQVGEETGKLSDMLLQIAIFYEEEIENKTKNLSTIIEPVLMVFIGAGVGFFTISMISPLYSILGSIK
ncbi:MAG: type II secretion system F family protein [Patescibacteria group bacterium]